MAKSMGAWPSIKLPTEKNIAVPKLDSPSSSNGGTRFKDDSNLSVGW